MQNVTSLDAHGRFKSWRGLSMSQRQVNNELFPQIAYFPGAEANVLCGQLFDNFVSPPVVQEKRLADSDHHIITKGAARGHQAAQLLRRIDRRVLTTPAPQKRFVSREATQVQRVHRPVLGFVNLERGLTLRTIGLGRAKGQHEPFGEE
jgi:hypothetical protein